jgi:hypothetical protein
LKIFRETVPYNDESLKKALKTIATYDADLGGTEIYKPLLDILQSKVYKNYTW